MPHPKFAIPILARAFSNMVKRYGRITESWLVIKLSFRIGLVSLLGMASLGMNLLRTGRIRLGKEKVKNRDQIKKIFNALEAKA